MAKNFLARANELEGELIAWRRELHRHPELEFDLPATTAFVREKLESFGLHPQTVGRAGMAARLGGPGKTILLRADMDALPMQEETGLPYASLEAGRMHACGHDFHTAALLGAAKMLSERVDALRGAVLFVFQANEEGLSGARDMIESGLFDGGKPDAALAQHVVLRSTGSAGITQGAACASCDVFRITVHGTGTHGAAPHIGVDPINAAAHLVTALQALNARETAPGAMFVLTVCSIQGGTTHNVIPQECVLTGTIRTMDNAVRAHAKKRLVEITKSVAETFRARGEVEFVGGIPPIFNDDGLRADYSRYIDELFGEGTASDAPPMTGSEDFALIAERVPSALVMFGVGGHGEGYHYNIHHPKAVFNEAALPGMSAVYAQCAMRWLEEHA